MDTFRCTYSIYVSRWRLRQLLRISSLLNVHLIEGWVTNHYFDVIWQYKKDRLREKVVNTENENDDYQYEKYEDIMLT